MSKYGNVARLAVNKARAGIEPRQAWEDSAKAVFPGKPASQAKGCPKDTFLGLAEGGLIKGIRAGHYTNSKKNKDYAMKAIALLRRTPNLVDAPEQMWLEVMAGVKKQHNSQMDVVSALWENGDVKHST